MSNHEKVKVSLSDPEVQAKFFAYITRYPPEMGLVKNYVHVKFKSWKESLMISRDCFRALHTKIVDLNTVLNDYEFTLDCIGSNEFDDVMNDMMMDFAFNRLPKGFLLDQNDKNPLYLDYRGCESREYHIVGDKILFRVVSYFWLAGSEYSSLLNDVDLTKFILRRYDKESSDPAITNNTERNVTTFMRGNEIDCIEPEIDLNLLKSWMTFQLMKQVLPVTLNPFFERDGLIHQKSKGSSLLKPEYKLPKELVDFNKTLSDLQLCRQYHDSEWF